MQGAGIRKAGSLRMGHRVDPCRSLDACSLSLQVDAQTDCEMTRIYLRIIISRRIRHPREGGGPLKAVENMDSRLRGNDDRLRTYDEKEF